MRPLAMSRLTRRRQAEGDRFTLSASSALLSLPSLCSASRIWMSRSSSWVVGINLENILISSNYQPKDRPYVSWKREKLRCSRLNIRRADVVRRADVEWTIGRAGGSSNARRRAERDQGP